jgi:hypothetical protein
MRYIYVLIVMTALAFVAAGPARGDGDNPSKSCPQHYTWNNSKGACVPPSCKRGYTWDNRENKCEPDHH